MILVDMESSRIKIILYVTEQLFVDKQTFNYKHQISIIAPSLLNMLRP
jgi:hypothetical protein